MSVACFLTASPSAFADEALRARAEALLADARARMASHDYDAACPKFAESQQLAPSPRTLLNLATCYEAAGKTASAWATYESAVVAADAVGDESRFAAASKKAAELKPSLSHLKFVAAATTRAAGYDIRCDGEPLVEDQWGDPLPTDPGSHEVTVHAPGHPTWSTRIEVPATGDTVTVRIPSFEASDPYGEFDIDIAPPATAVPSAAAPPFLSKEREPPKASADTNGSSRRTVGLVLGGVGAVGLLTGIVTAVAAGATYTSANCSNTACTPSGVEVVDRARSYAAVSTVAFVTGAAALVAGGVVFFTAPHGAATVATSVGPSGASLDLGGVF